MRWTTAWKPFGWTALAVAALVLAACTGTEETAGPREAPEGWVTHDVDGVTIATPEDWTEDPEENDQSAGQSSTLLRSDDSREAPSVGITVVHSPDRSLDEQVDGILATVLAAFGVGDVVPEPVDLPGAAEATRFTYVAAQPGETSGMIETRSSWVLATLDDGRHVLAVLSGRTDLLDDEASTVLASLSLPH